MRNVQKIYDDIKKHRNIEINLLQFADNIIFLNEISVQNCLIIKSKLRCFKLVSSPKIGAVLKELNEKKKKKTLLMTKILKCKIILFPFIYLKISIGANPRKEMELVLMVIRKLSSWKWKVLSLAGPMCLINFLLVLIPLFYILVFKIPKKKSGE